MKKFVAACGCLCIGVVVSASHIAAGRSAVVDVSTVAQLESAVAGLVSGTTIRIAPGRYAVTQQLRIRNNVTNVSLVGATGNRGDVVIVGTGMRTPGVNIALKVENAQDVTIADLSIGEAFYHPIQLQGELGADRVRISNVRLFDAGQQFLKSTYDAAAVVANGVDDVVVENSLIEFTSIGPDDGYTEGIDVHHGANWIIRHNTFRNIRVPPTAVYRSRPAILMWSGSQNTTVEGNTIINCERGIIFGQGPQPPNAHSHSGGLIANNVIYRTDPVNADSGISLWDSPGTRVYHNTIIQNGTYPTAIEYRFAPTTGVEIVNNLTDAAILQRDGASALVSNNYTQALASFFVNAPAIDLHLTRLAVPALQQGVAVAGVPFDIDGDRRPADAATELGADEFYPWHTTEPPIVLEAPADLRASVSKTSVQLNWTDRSISETHYVVERATDKRDGFRVVARLGADASSLTDVNLVKGQYRYRVRAFCAENGQYSPYSPVVSARVK